MVTNEKNNVIVELYDLSITERKDDRFGRVVTIKSLNEDDLINIAVSERTDLNPNSLRSSMQILKEIAKKQLANGSSVAFGLGYFSLGVNG
ncbi:MAG: DNA-binding domain-containing protein, partial [Paludibacter sp.]|nr:DNA-binding domain-containing protein [Paludibacter sp.]